MQTGDGNVSVFALSQKNTRREFSVGLYNKRALARPAIANYNDAGNAHPLLNNRA